ncbi:HNH endonuclease [Mesoplasma whartonense]|uniref:HNH endonuclease n=1 Tax=Mesoplasma whartonense TaxID=2878854 RepID=UPI002022A2EC|nr:MULTISPECIES: HNH endonuclease [unclassified Mesoplasma]MCL8212760.1 hypothetical protein [Mesoplasma sp. JKS002661]MCL8215761.1 hypothetical protein [Mesoplasma sp. JKS002657]
MSEKTEKWDKTERNLIWKSYISEKLNHNFSIQWQLKMSLSLSEAAPCPNCGKIMLKAQYQDFQPQKSASWIIGFLDGNSKNNSIKNLVPIHPWCAKKKKNG